MDGLHVEQTGRGGPVFVMLHGMGMHGGTWTPLAQALSAQLGATVLAPDLRGHGRSPGAARYSYGQHAADVADLLPANTPIYLVGHSMGGAIALLLASGLFGFQPRGVYAFSTKVDFADTELERLAAVARTSVKFFDTQQEAAARFVKVAGLEGLAAPDSPMALAGITRDGDRYRLAADIRTVLAAGPSMRKLHANALCSVSYACGENDAMVQAADLASLGAEADVIPAAGHNPHVERPLEMAQLLTAWFRRLNPA